MEKVHEINSKPLVIEEDIPETHKCELCSREFVNEQALQKHISDHANEKRKEKEPETNIYSWSQKYSCQRK